MRRRKTARKPGRTLQRTCTRQRWNDRKIRRNLARTITTLRDDSERQPAFAKTEAAQNKISAEDKGKRTIEADNQAETR
jgi:hypothetical protein